MAPLRGAGTGFDATEKPMAASPCPPRSPAMEIHAGTAVIDHVQSRVVEMFIVPVPPLGPKDTGVPPTET